MFNLFKSKEDTIKELEAQIDTTNYKVVQGKDGKWAFKEHYGGDEWYVVTGSLTGDKLEVIKTVLDKQKQDIEREKQQANFS